MTRSIPSRSSGDTRSAPPSGADPAGPGILFRELRAQRSARHRLGAAERSRVRLARWTLPESVAWSSVQRACRRAPPSQPLRLRPVHARSQSCVLQRRGRAVPAVCLVPIHGPAQSESCRGHERVVAQRRQRASLLALLPGRGSGSRQPEDCPAPCFGLGAPRIVVSDAGVTFGASSASSDVGHRYQVSDNLVWQKGRHNLACRF